MRMRPLSVLLVCVLAWVPPAAADPPAPTPPKPPDGTDAPPSSAAPSELKFVVALIRHGVRAPLAGFVESVKGHSKRSWPALEDWRVMPFAQDGKPEWGDLTNHGYALASIMGAHYAERYQADFRTSFKVHLWSDLDDRTMTTAFGLVTGFASRGVTEVAVGSMYGWRKSCKADPLFHPFAAGCGTPDKGMLDSTAESLNGNWARWAEANQVQLQQLYTVLGCKDARECGFELADRAVGCAGYSKDCNAPVKWTGRFLFASGATEALLLEYANRMTVDWGTIQVPPPADKPWILSQMLQLHELFFDHTDRDPYIAQIEGSNLLREIYDEINLRAGGTTLGGCPREPTEAQFVGLVGHDTNLASVGALLNLGWRFDDASLSRATRDLPDNQALPTSGLVFELRRKPDSKPGEGFFVRILYVAQGLEAMRGALGDVSALRVRAADRQLADPCNGSNPCELPLEVFNKLAKDRLYANPFLSGCAGDPPNRYQVCPKNCTGGQ